MLGQLSGRVSLPQAALRAGLIVLPILLWQHLAMQADWAYHAVPGWTTYRWLGLLPHPWVPVHFAVVLGWPIIVWQLASLFQPDTARRQRDHGLSMLTVLGRR